MIQGSDEWKAVRCGVVTASRFADVMTNGKGGQPSKTSQAYMLEKIGEILTGKPADEITAKQVAWGNEHEPSARSKYVWEHGVELCEIGFVKHPKLPRVGASPDALIKDGAGNVVGGIEIKCPWNTSVHLNTMLSRNVPSDYEWQVQGNMACSGALWWDFVSFDPRLEDGLDLVVIRVQRDDEMIGDLEERLKEFVEVMEAKLKKIRAKVSA
jgi:putative phage-type endonuclease